MKINLFIIIAFLASNVSYGQHSRMPEIGLYRIFEVSIKNTKSYDNKFADVALTGVFVSPSGKVVRFPGFFDGDGKGGGDMDEGTIWKIRFMPDEPGSWNYTYEWSDDSKAGKGSFQCIKDNDSPGPLAPYEKNPHWFAYNGKKPVWLKSYYETGHGSIAQDFEWIKNNVYDPLIDNGYNHLQVNWLLSLCCFGQYYLDGPQPETLDLSLYQEASPSTTMNLNVWRLMERHLQYLNDRNVAVHMFLGFDGGRNEGPAWDKLSDSEKDFYVRYVVSRIAPFANLAGWNFVWEVDGDREDYELGWARLVKKYDVFGRMVTYEDEFPRENEYEREEYDFAAVENHLIAAHTKDLDRPYWKEAWTHHMAAIMGYRGKPVFMSEGNGLWRRFWHERTGATQDDLRQSAWACAVGGASFTWNGHAKEYELYAGGATGLPFNEENEFKTSEKYIAILSRVMNEEVEFYRMVPSDHLLKSSDPFRVWALAEEGSQYLVFSMHGEPFGIQLTAGNYERSEWLDTKTGEARPIDRVNVKGEHELVQFNPPDQATDWALILRKNP